MWRDPWGYNSRIFEQIDKEFSDAEDMLNRMFRTVRESRRWHTRDISVLLRVPDNDGTRWKASH